MYSIIVPTYGIDGIMMLDSLLASISTFENNNLDEIIISDDGTTFDTTEYLNRLEHKYSKLFKIKIIHNPPYHSFSKTVNSGLTVSNPRDDVLLLNNDMIALTSFEPFIDFAADNNKIGIIGAKLLYKNLRIQHAGMVRMRLLNDFRHVYRHRNYNYEPTNISKKYIAVTGACQYIRRDLINTIGYFDERYVMGYEDVDYCLNAMLNGYEVWYMPDVIMIHYESATKNKVNDSVNKNAFWNKWKYLYEKIKTENQIPDDSLDINIAKSLLVALAYLTVK